MAFSESVKDAAYKLSGGICECTRQHSGRTDAPHHGGRCTVTFSRHGNWQAHHIISVSAGGSVFMPLISIWPSICIYTVKYGMFNGVTLWIFNV
jgi:hypothetical protein